jgi:uncharacterized membrane protein YdjX (TVP38/TMEM64 family)
MTSQIEHVVHGAGIGAPIAFVVIYAALTVALVPESVSSVAAGALFGALWGTLLTVAGATLGATGAFLIARRLGRAPLRARSGAATHAFVAFGGSLKRPGSLGFVTALTMVFVVALAAPLTDRVLRPGAA